MYAVIATGGKQYRVEAGTVLRIELLTADAGTEVKFGDVLLVGSGDSVRRRSPVPPSPPPCSATVKGTRSASSSSGGASTTCA
jgi:ribosomal protein L21